MRGEQSLRTGKKVYLRKQAGNATPVSIRLARFKTATFCRVDHFHSGRRFLSLRLRADVVRRAFMFCVSSSSPVRYGLCA